MSCADEEGECSTRHSTRVSPQISNRMVSQARGILNRFLPDVYIYSDVYRGEESGKSVAATSIS